MSVTEEASAAANTATDAAPGDTPTVNGDEQGGASLTGTPELRDPAILAVNPKFRYGKDELLKLRDAPLSQRKPDFLDVNEVSPTIWDPTRWNGDRKKSDTPTENGTRAGDEHRRRPGDPRERIRKENDGIVLSPQRRSFNSGCCVPGREPRNSSATGTNRPHSPLGAGGKNDTGSHLGGGGGVGGGVREIQTGNRRIGSGRILRDWDFGDGKDNNEEYNFRPQTNQERRSFGRDFDATREKEKERRSGGRFGDRRRIGGSEPRDEEPEWFSGGPSSQNDTIELRGFDDAERLGKKKMSPSQAKRARDWFKKKTEVASVTEEKEDVTVEGAPDGRSTPMAQAENEKDGKDENQKKEGEGDGKTKQEQQKNMNDSLFEDILKSDSIPGLPALLSNGVGGDGDNAKSRFSKWFSVEPNHASDSRRSSIQDESIIKNLLKDLNEPSVSIPGDSNSYFAPISPAANTGTGLNSAANAAKSINIMEMLQRGKQNESGGHKTQVSGRIMNLNELEAKMRQTAEPQMPKHTQKTEEDMTAFNRLLAHISSAHNATANPKTQQPMTLMEMLSHSQQQDEAHARMAQLLGPTSPGASSHDLAARLQQAQSQKQQQQVEMLSKLMNAGMQVRASPLPEMGLQQSRELLSRPEAQAILQGLKIGDITPQHLYQQLANPALQPRHREMLVTILKLQGGGGVGPSPRVLSPVAPHPLFQQQQQQQQQQLRVSPLPPNALHQRIPSPRELQVHTQNILQRALIKKKLEEQQENYRKKQEMQQRGQSPNNNNNNNTSSNNNNSAQQPTKSVSSPTPLAFTPTSVLRKMTAEKDEGGKDVSKLVEGAKLAQGRAVTGMRPQTQQQQTQQQWSQYQMNMTKPTGRPIVKANSFQPQQQQEQFFAQQQQQQKFLNQLQQQQQQRKAPYHGHGSIPSHHPQYPPTPNNQQFSQLTQQQLRAQHQQQARPSNVQQQGQQQQQQAFGNQQGNASWQQYLNPQSSRGQVGRGGVTDGDLSPTSNQLTRWFSPDLLERARVGELPSTAGLSQHLLSLEEIERLTAPPVHN